MLMRICSILFLIIVYACKPSKDYCIAGLYESRNSSLYEKIIYPFDSYALGIKLLVQEDSAFCLEKCSSVARGKWKVIGDSLILTSYSHISTIDSSQLNNGTYAYFISGDGELCRMIITEKKKKIRDFLMKDNCHTP